MVVPRSETRAPNKARAANLSGRYACVAGPGVSIDEPSVSGDEPAHSTHQLYHRPAAHEAGPGLKMASSTHA
jgi:hypothetical protein